LVRAASTHLQNGILTAYIYIYSHWTSSPRTSTTAARASTPQ
jgi:hypothetical protein